MRRKGMQFLVIALVAVSLLAVSVASSEAGHYRRHWGHHNYYRPFWGGVYFSPFYGYPAGGYYPGYYPYSRPYYSYGYPYYPRPYANVGVPFYYPFLPGISFHFGF
ncbi:MAG: hypothetical protein AB9873_00025 [Syntrophobacteraceae bacterium]